MKAKLWFALRALQSIADKLVVASVIGVSVLFVLVGVVRIATASDPGLTSDSISSAAEHLSEKVRSSEFTDACASHIVPTARSVADVNPAIQTAVRELAQPISAEAYEWRQWFHKFQDFGDVLRGTPDVVVPEDLEVFPVLAATQVKNPVAEPASDPQSSDTVAPEMNYRSGPVRNTPSKRKRRRFIELDDEKATTVVKDTSTNAREQRFEITEAPVSCLVLTATVKNQRQIEFFLKSLKGDRSLPVYARVDVQRRSLLEDGTFSPWSMVDQKPINEFEQRVAEWEVEHPALGDAILVSLVRRMPQLLHTAWPAIVDRREALAVVATSSEARKSSALALKDTETKTPTELKGPDPSSMSMDQSSSYRGAGARNQNGSSQQGSYGGRGAQGYDGNETRGKVGSEMMANPQMQTPESDREKNSRVRRQPLRRTQRKKRTETRSSSLPVVQIRFLDYTVDLGVTYQYRIRLVIQNPNYLRRDVVDPATKIVTELIGEWSDASTPIVMPGKPELFLVGTRSRNRAKMQVQLWNQGRWETGDFVIRPGNLVGETKRRHKSVQLDGTVRVESKDFATGEFLVDVRAEQRDYKFPDYGNISVVRPAEALLLKEDGELETLGLIESVRDVERQERFELQRALLAAAVKKPKERSTAESSQLYNRSSVSGPGR